MNLQSKHQPSRFRPMRLYIPDSDILATRGTAFQLFSGWDFTATAVYYASLTSFGQEFPSQVNVRTSAAEGIAHIHPLGLPYI